MYESVPVSVSESVKYLCDDGEDSGYGHRSGAIGESSYGKFCGQYYSAVYDVCVFHGHNMAVAELCDHSDFAEQGVIFLPPIDTGIGDFQGYPNTFDAVFSLPHDGTCSFTESFFQAVFSEFCTPGQFRCCFLICFFRHIMVTCLFPGLFGECGSEFTGRDRI